MRSAANVNSAISSDECGSEKALQDVQFVAPNDTVLIRTESGTGKEPLAPSTTEADSVGSKVLE
jgi:transcriptional regulator with GAF, ATPase, and Fis domain